MLLLLFSHSVMSDSLDSMDHSTPGLPVPHHLLEVIFVDALNEIQEIPHLFLFFWEFWIMNRCWILPNAFSVSINRAKIESAHLHAAKPMQWHQVMAKESAESILRRHAKRVWDGEDSNLNSSVGFRKAFLKPRCRKGVPEHEISLCTILIGW